ncbi:MAG: type II secretion system F family protein [Actinobacteria bacterium]|nr:type II secretion system F family protein [Actinomycetota bacterium]
MSSTGLPAAALTPLAVPLAAFAAATACASITGRAMARAGRLRERRGSKVGARAVSARPLLAALQRGVPGLVNRAGRRDARDLIAAAGVSGEVSPRDVAAARVLCGVLAVLLAPRMAAFLPGRMLPLVLPLWVLAGAEAPLWWLRRSAARRAEATRAALPDALDLLHACLAAGLPLRRSLLLAGDHCADPIAGELVCVAAETALGIPQAVALDGLVARNPLPELRALVGAIRQAERHGSPLGPVIAAQAGEVRRARDRAIVESGSRAAPKIQLIVATTIVPAALLALAAVVIAAIARGDIEFV